MRQPQGNMLYLHMYRTSTFKDDLVKLSKLTCVTVSQLVSKAREMVVTSTAQYLEAPLSDRLVTVESMTEQLRKIATEILSQCISEYNAAFHRIHTYVPVHS